jgi:cytochrome c nitrite reductase small subunit
MQSFFMGTLPSGEKRGTALPVALAVVLGMLAGIGGFTFLYAEGFSYMSDDPKVCANCHIMQPQYDSWQKASHHTVATCVDCHLPHGLIRKYLSKAENGFHHSRAFTFQDFHEPIMIKEKSSRILQDNCVHCHAALVHLQVAQAADASADVRCTHCHSSVGHGEAIGVGRRAEANTKGETP